MSRTSKQEVSRKAPVVLEKIAEKRAVPGVLSFTATMQLLYMNSEAEELCQQIKPVHLEHENHENGAKGNGTIPQEIGELCRSLQEKMYDDPDSKDNDEIQLRRVIGDSNFPILLRGFLIPGQNDEDEARFLVLMEKLGRRSQVPTDVAKKHFQLTDREHEIVTHVADGRTNREIAEALDISEHTVKEHIKHILRKTQSGTRTGILAQILRYS